MPPHVGNWTWYYTILGIPRRSSMLIRTLRGFSWEFVKVKELWINRNRSHGTYDEIPVDGGIGSCQRATAITPSGVNPEHRCRSELRMKLITRKAGTSQSSLLWFSSKTCRLEMLNFPSNWEKLLHPVSCVSSHLTPVFLGYAPAKQNKTKHKL